TSEKFVSERGSVLLFVRCATAIRHSPTSASLPKAVMICGLAATSVWAEVIRFSKRSNSMPTTPKPITHEDVANGAADTAAFLRRLEAAIPGHVDEELLHFLDSLGQSRMTLELLTKAMGNGAR